MNPHLEKSDKNRTRETRRTNELHIRFLSLSLSLSVKTDRIIFETKQTTTYRGKRTNFRDRKRETRVANDLYRTKKGKER